METKRLADEKSELEEGEHLLRQMNQRVDDIIAPLRSGALGKNVSAQFHLREKDRSCYSITFFAFTEDQAKRNSAPTDSANIMKVGKKETRPSQFYPREFAIATDRESCLPI